MSQIARVPHALFPFDNLRPIIRRLPLREFAMAIGIPCSTSASFDSVLGLSGFSSQAIEVITLPIPAKNSVAFALSHSMTGTQTRKAHSACLHCFVSFSQFLFLFYWNNSYCHNLCSPQLSGTFVFQLNR